MNGLGSHGSAPVGAPACRIRHRLLREAGSPQPGPALRSWAARGRAAGREAATECRDAAPPATPAPGWGLSVPRRGDRRPGRRVARHRHGRERRKPAETGARARSPSGRARVAPPRFQPAAPGAGAGRGSCVPLAGGAEGGQVPAVGPDAPGYEAPAARSGASTRGLEPSVWAPDRDGWRRRRGR